MNGSRPVDRDTLASLISDTTGLLQDGTDLADILSAADLERITKALAASDKPDGASDSDSEQRSLPTVIDNMAAAGGPPQDQTDMQHDVSYLTVIQ